MEMIDKPIASLLVFFYNQERFVEETIKGALSQTYENLEIIFSDDCSTDNTFNIIKNCVRDYKGPHKIVLNRNEKNLGLIPHFNKLIFEIANGDYLILNGGDDVSLPNRVSSSVNYLMNSSVDSVSFNYYRIDSNSNNIGESVNGSSPFSVEYRLKDFLNDNYHTGGCTRAIKKSLLKDFGPFMDDCQTEDTTIVFRSFLRHGLGYNNTIVLKYRIHNNNLSGHDNLMRKFDPRKIYNQYKHDLQIAQDKGYVNEEDYKKLKECIDHYLSWNIAKREVYLSPRWKKFFVVCNLFKDKKLSVKEVLSLTPLYRLFI